MGFHHLVDVVLLREEFLAFTAGSPMMRRRALKQLRRQRLDYQSPGGTGFLETDSTNRVGRTSMP